MNNVELSEKEHAACLYIFDRVSGVAHSGGSFFGHLYNTFYILKSMGANEDTCLAGLYHSVYGTERFQYKSEITRENVLEVIGERAESLVHLYSMDGRFKIIIDNILGLDDLTRLSLVQIMYANDKEQNNNGIISSRYTEHLANLRKLIVDLGGNLP